MPRSIRIEYPGAFYHVMARGNRREPIFLDEADYRYFLKTFGEACEMTGWRAHAWVLMSNHYHLLIETPTANLVEGMTWLQKAYTRRFNTRHQLWGRLFGDRYKAVIVQSEENDYFASLLDYLHLNPVRAGLIRPGKDQSVSDYLWSSVAGGYALPGGRRPKWFAAEMGLKAFGCKDTVAGRRKFVHRLNERAVTEEMERCGVPPWNEEVDARLSRLDRGWYWGKQEFAEKLLKLGEKMIATKQGRAHRYSGEKKQHDEKEAEEIVIRGTQVAGLKEEDWADLSGADVRKVALAQLVWQRTTVSQSWIAERLCMSSAANVSQQIRRWKREPQTAKLPRDLRNYLSKYAT